ncbi:MAG: hypothetical protein CSB55_08060 [Candidatus Cloacimonadota bacterium]|nr:MAG: hypothetical protein CSB55_08060 [Candidatus Cloacimonadota bacterium]
MCKSNIAVFFLVVLIISGCKFNRETDKSSEYFSDENQCILYRGFLPSSDGSGMITSLKLNKDGSFEKSDLCLKSDYDYSIDTGSFVFGKNSSYIILTSENETFEYENKDNGLIFSVKDLSDSTIEYKLTEMSNCDIEFGENPVQGFLVFGHEVSSFSPFNSSKVYWINDFKDGKLTKLYYEKVGDKLPPYTPLKANLVLRKSNALKQGFTEEYDGILDVKEIKSAELITAENYTEK